MNRCSDDCRYLNVRWDKSWCDKKNNSIKNRVLFCPLFKAHNCLTRFLHWLGL